MSYREASEDSWDNGKRKTEILAAQQTEKAANPEGSGTKGLCKGCIPKKRTPGEGNSYPLLYPVASLVAQTVKRLPTMWKTGVQSLGQEDPLEKEMATHSSTLAWKISWMEEPGRLQCMGSQKVRHD